MMGSPGCPIVGCRGMTNKFLVDYSCAICTAHGVGSSGRTNERLFVSTTVDLSSSSDGDG